MTGLSNSDALYRVLVDEAPDAVVAINVDSRILLANPALERMFGFSAADLVGTSLSRLMPERFRAAHNNGITRYLSTGHRNLDWRGVRIFGVRADGTEFPITISFGETEINGERAFLGFIRDLTSEVAAAAALREAQSLHEGLLASVGAGIVGLDTDGRITFANPAASKLLGRPIPDLIRRNFHDTAHHTRRDGLPFPADECPLSAAFGDSRTYEFNDLHFFHSDGTMFPVEGVATPLKDGEVAKGSVVVFQDVTQRQALEEQLRQRHKMEGVGQLAGGIAHDFNNMLSVMMAHAEFLLIDLQGEEARNDVIAIRQAAERAAALTRQLLAYSRRQVLRPRPISLFEVVSGVKTMLRRLIGEHIKLAVRRGTEFDTVYADRVQLEQVITNLMLNARDAMPEGGTLSIEVACTSEKPPKGVSLGAGPFVVLRVADNGVGMDATTQQRAVEPFFTTKAPGEGTGFGLATASGIVSQSGGWLTIESELNKGTVVSVFLPCVSEVAPSDVETQKPRIAEPEASATLLVVEDEGALREACIRTLERAGYSVLRARHGADAILVATNYSQPIDLLVTDVVMPEVGGVELSEWFRTTFPKAPIIFMSGYTDDEMFRHQKSDFNWHFLAKPFQGSALLAKVAEALKKSARD